jgi:hypothetical protein
MLDHIRDANQFNARARAEDEVKSTCSLPANLFLSASFFLFSIKPTFALILLKLIDFSLTHLSFFSASYYLTKYAVFKSFEPLYRCE